ncbi:MAG: peptide ABC transporter substrate-binding protein [Oscillospiraceae bacterium]|nr:peptide ABC transporter substrate-binding protein [Oscillospiraceae bacterium]
MKKILALLLALAMMLSLVACGGTDAPAEEPAEEPAATDEETPAASEAVEYVDPYADLAEDYTAQSEAIYHDILGEFYEAYEAAKAVENVSERYALMAIAEAKLMESAVMLPLTSNGGNYAISRVVPNTATSTLWGNDYERYHNVLVCTEPLTAEHRAELKAMWAELAGTGTWVDSAKAYVEEKGYTLKDSYTFGYSSDPLTWDVLNTSRSADSEAIINTYDGLLEYDSENILQPALAESYEVSPDGLTYTFKIREGAVWTDSQGRKVADVVADDFVAGMQHMMDAQGGLEYLVQGIIVNATEYITGEITDFSQVGVKAIDDYTLEYTLCQPTSYFVTMLGYGCFAPMSRTYYTQCGGQFGADFDSTAEGYTYGTSPDTIAYCGPYTVSNFTAENTIVFKANPSYWNADNITMKSLTWLYNDGEDATKAYNDTMSGVLDGAGLNASAVEAAKSDGVFDTYAYVAATDATSFMAFYNLNRLAFSNFNDGSVASTKTPEAAVRDTGALRNEHFRRALSFATDRGAYNAQTVGEELKYTSMRNSYTPGTFVYLTEDVTVAINGTDTTFEAGTYYGEIMQAQIDADGVEMMVWDPTADDGIGSSDGFDGWYNPEAAQAELALAVEELAAIGIEVSAENPIYIDLPYFSGSEAYGNRANAYKQSLETVLGGAVIVNLVECVDSAAWYYAGYYTTYGYEGNYDMYDVSGWGPDYGDPATYLDTFLPDYAGYMVKCIGLF